MRNYSTPQYQQSPRMGATMYPNSPGYGPPTPEPRSASYHQRQYNDSQYAKPSYEHGRRPTASPHMAPTSGFGTVTTTITTTTSHKDIWLEEARESTINFNKHGSPVPLVWVLVEDKTIPPNAVPFGEDRHGHTLFIARAHFEGGLHIGKVGFHTPGALISYLGKEHPIETYEVLVIASQLRWGLASQDPTSVLVPGTVIIARQQAPASLRVKDIPRFIAHPHHLVQEEELRRVAEYKTVVLVDDSISMTEGDCWNQVGDALAGIVDIAMQYGSKGIDIHFMQQQQYADDVKTRLDVQKLFEQYGPTAMDTPTGARLGQLIEMYLPLVELPSSTHASISIIVITDGAATDGDELVHCIIDAANRLDKQQIPLDKFRIQFMQIGTDLDARNALRVLDNELSATYKVRDIVDATPFDPALDSFNTDYMLKILLGSLRKDLPAALFSPEKKLSSLGPVFDRHSSPIPRSGSSYTHGTPRSTGGYSRA